MAHGYFYITDHTSTTSSDNLFNGSSIKCWVTRCTISGKNNVDISFKPNQDFDLTTDDNSNIGSAWNRRKCHVQSSGAENMQITLSGGWEVEQLGSGTGTIATGFEPNLSPWKLMRIGLSGHNFFLKGGTALQWILEGETADSTNGSYYIPGSGIPIHVTDWNIEDSAEEIDYVTWTLTLSEDKDTINMTN